MDMNFDRGVTKLVAHPETHEPVMVESQGFVVMARVATQVEARAIKRTLRKLGFPDVDYELVATRW